MLENQGAATNAMPRTFSVNEPKCGTMRIRCRENPTKLGGVELCPQQTSPAKQSGGQP